MSPLLACLIMLMCSWVWIIEKYASAPSIQRIGKIRSFAKLFLTAAQRAKALAGEAATTAAASVVLDKVATTIEARKPNSRAKKKVAKRVAAKKRAAPKKKANTKKASRKATKKKRI